MKQPTTYLSPEECKKGEGLRCLHDPRFFMPPEPDPLPAPLLAEIEAALAQRTLAIVAQVDYNKRNNSCEVAHDVF